MMIEEQRGVGPDTHGTVGYELFDGSDYATDRIAGRKVREFFQNRTAAKIHTLVQSDSGVCKLI